MGLINKGRTRLDDAPAKNTKERASASSGTADLHIRHVSKSFGTGARQNLVLSDVSLDIPFGQVLGIVGPTGCGKTTLLDIICGLGQPDPGGSVALGEEDVTGRRGVFAYMPQRDALLPWRTALANAALGLTVRGVAKEEAERRARDLFTTFGLAKYQGYHPQQLSGGMRQRVALLRTFLFPSSYMLLDEPFSALDAITRSNIHLWLLAALNEMRRTVVLITHDITEAIFLSDRVIVMGAHPGHIALDVDVPIPRPRTLDVETLDAFQQVRKETLAALADFVADFGAPASTPVAATTPNRR